MSQASLYSEEAENALVARLILDPSQIPMASGQLHPDDFFVADNRVAYRAMLQLAEQGEPVDLMTIRHQAGRPGLHLPVLDFKAGMSAPLDTYVEIVRKMSFRRKVFEMGEHLSRQALETEDPNQLMSKVQEAMAVVEAGMNVEASSLGQVELDHYRTPPEPAWLGVLSPEGTTILYGDGGDGKGWVAAKWISQLKKRVAILDFEMHPQEWAYRLDKFGFSLDDVSYFSPPMTLDMWAGPQAVRYLRDQNVEFLVVDSAMYASNVEDPYSPAGALAYGRARRRLSNLPALLLAHTTGNADKVFGSVFWRNEARVVWRLQKDFVNRQRHLECRKANAYSDLEGVRLDIVFNEKHGVLDLTRNGLPFPDEELEW